MIGALVAFVSFVGGGEPSYGFSFFLSQPTRVTASTEEAIIRGVFFPKNVKVDHLPVDIQDGRVGFELSSISLGHRSFFLFEESNAWPDRYRSASMIFKRVEQHLPIWIISNKHPANHIGFVRRSLPGVLKSKFYFNGPILVDVAESASFQCYIGTQLTFRGIPRNFVGIDRQDERRDNAKGANNADSQRPEGPVCRVSSGACGIPLRAKVGLLVLLALPAWLLIFAGIGCFSDLFLRAHYRIKGTLYTLAGLSCFGLCAFI